jgi:hypothetical protein
MAKKVMCMCVVAELEMEEEGADGRENVSEGGASLLYQSSS